MALKQYLLFLLVLLFSYCLRAQEKVIVPHHRDKKVIIPVSPIDAVGRRDLDFNDADWMLYQGSPGGIGYDQTSRGFPKKPYRIETIICLVEIIQIHLIQRRLSVLPYQKAHMSVLK
ncbi:hypothetical protein EH223_12305 [candidate division KSB1 bacterium]|nr:MAG: hypothetical protein EH223_12305 [candidate division KSB1 bacterium]